MKLSKDIKNKIEEEYTNWFNSQYGQVSKEKRKELGAVFTPPSLTIEMIEKFSDIKDKDILDPTCGAGNLLVACIIAGADPKRVYGNEYSAEFLKVARDRLCPMGVPEENLHQGNALQKLCLTDFSKEYLKNYNPEYIDDEKYAQGPVNTGSLWDNVMPWSWESENNDAKLRA